MAADTVVTIGSDADMVIARGRGRALAEGLGFSRTDATLIATAISEIARNIVVHVGEGEIALEALREEDRRGVLVVARDAGAGIRDVEAALRDGVATRGRLGLGLGLPGARRLMDEFDVVTEVGRGTTVRMIKWRRLDELERLRERRRQRAAADAGTGS